MEIYSADTIYFKHGSKKNITGQYLNNDNYKEDGFSNGLYNTFKVAPPLLLIDHVDNCELSLSLVCRTLYAGHTKSLPLTNDPDSGKKLILDTVYPGILCNSVNSLKIGYLQYINISFANFAGIYNFHNLASVSVDEYRHYAGFSCALYNNFSNVYFSIPDNNDDDQYNVDESTDKYFVNIIPDHGLYTINTNVGVFNSFSKCYISQLIMSMFQEKKTKFTKIYGTFNVSNSFVTIDESRLFVSNDSAIADRRYFIWYT